MFLTKHCFFLVHSVKVLSNGVARPVNMQHTNSYDTQSQLAINQVLLLDYVSKCQKSQVKPHELKLICDTVLNKFFIKNVNT